MIAGFQTYAIVGGLAVVIAWCCVASLVSFAPTIGLLDRPNERSSHTRVTPRGGGIGIVLVTTLIFAWLISVSDELRVPLFIVVSTACVLAAVSLRDDFKPLGAGLRMLCQLVIAVAAVVGVAYFREFPWITGGTLNLGMVGLGLTVVWIVGLTNVYNFMDGIDGIAGIQGLIAGLAWTTIGCLTQSPVVAIIGLTLSGGCLGFLFHNWSPAKIFMGDVGSAFLGFAFATIPLIALREAALQTEPLAVERLPLIALVIVWPFVADGGYTFLRRLGRGEVVWEAHRTHLYQRLVVSGWSHRRVSLLYGVWEVISAIAAVAILLQTNLWAFVATTFAVLGLPGISCLVRCRENRIGAAR